MGTIWGILFVAGLALPALLAGASVFLVYRLAKMLRTRDPDASSAPKIVGVHIAVMVFAAILVTMVGLGFLELAGIAVVPLYLAARIRRLPAKRGFARERMITDTPSMETTEATQGLPDPSELTDGISHKAALGIAWFIGVSGVVIPWLVGLGVKLYLQSQGRPTLPIAGFIDPASVPVLLLLSMAMWSSPFLVLALLVAFRFSLGGSKRYSFRYNRPLVWWTYTAGVVAAVLVFIRIFWEFDSMLLLVPVSFFLIPPMALTFWIVTRFSRAAR